MKEQFCDYNISSALKELGFDEECFGYYPGTEDIVYEIDKTNSNLNKPGMQGKYCTAVLYQQTIDWFREKHDIHIIINWIHIDSSDFYPEGKAWFYVINHKIPMERYNTHTKAKEKAILKAIELIK